jgi:rhodanese-related sulfurtransferase
MGIFSLMIMTSLIHPAVAIAGDTKDMVSRITVQELKAKMDHDGVLIIDVRSGDDYARSKIKIKGAVRISVVKLEEMSNTLPKDKEIVTYCT